jgi:hypothetical protein
MATGKGQRLMVAPVVVAASPVLAAMRPRRRKALERAERGHVALENDVRHRRFLSGRGVALPAGLRAR